MTALPDRQHTLTFLNADVVGYSRLLSDYLEATTQTMEAYRKLVDAEIGKGGGKLVDFVGDNFMAAFNDVKNAVQTAIAISSEIDTANADTDPPRRVRFRMGMERRAKATTEIIKSRFPAVDVAAWLDKNPYHIKALAERWKQDLASAGSIQPS